jgi:hypothetical protein
MATAATTNTQWFLVSGDVAVTMEQRDFSHPGKLTVLSVHGAYVDTKDRIPIGEIVILRVCVLGNGGVSIELKCVTAWQTETAFLAEDVKPCRLAFLTEWKTSRNTLELYQQLDTMGLLKKPVGQQRPSSIDPLQAW